MIFGPEKSLPYNAHSRLFRWALISSGYIYKIGYTKEVKVANCLSRLPLKEETMMKRNLIILNINQTSRYLLTLQKFTKEDPMLSQILVWFKHGWPNHFKKQYQNNVYKAYL